MTDKELIEAVPEMDEETYEQHRDRILGVVAEMFEQWMQGGDDDKH